MRLLHHDDRCGYLGHAVPNSVGLANTAFASLSDRMKTRELKAALQ